MSTTKFVFSDGPFEGTDGEIRWRGDHGALYEIRADHMLTGEYTYGKTGEKDAVGRLILEVTKWPPMFSSDDQTPHSSKD